MYLKNITISGFKSFSSKYRLDFEPGIVGIVGPNGSGKSNVADAIRWVLGEQSYKLLRAKKGEDVIFAGSAKKPKASCAEVSLFFDNSLAKATIDYHELEVTRRLYRSGDNDYFINRKKVRLIDIQELLAKSGFGRSSYSVVGQGMVDQLLFLSAEERKNLFTEATGVKHFEIQKEQVEKKLVSTEENLSRAQDILTELEPRLRLLKNQFKKASLRDEVEFELKDAQKKYYSVKWQTLKVLVDQKEGEKKLHTKELEYVQGELDDLNLEFEKRMLLHKKKLEGLKKLREELDQKSFEREKLKGKEIQLLGQLEVKKSLSSINFEQFDKEIKELEEKINSADLKIIIYKKELEEKEALLREKEEKLTKIKQEAKIIQDIRINKLKKLREELDQKSFEREKLKGKEIQLLGQLEVKKSLSSINFEQFDKEIKELEEKINSADLKIIIYKKELEEKEALLREKEIIAFNLNSDILSIEKYIKELKGESRFNRETFSAELDKLLDNYNSAVRKLKNTVNIEDVRLIEVEFEKLSLVLKQLLGEVEPEKSDKFKKIITLEENIEEISLCKRNTHLEIEDIKLANSSFRVNIDYLGKEKKSIQEQLINLKAKVEDVKEAKESISKINNQLLSVANKLEEFEPIFEQLRGNIKTLEDDNFLENSTRQETLILEMEKSRESIYEIKSKLEQKKSEQLSLQNQLNQIVINLEKAKKSIQESIDINKELTGLKKIVVTMEVEISSLKERLLKFEQELYRADDAEQTREQIKSKDGLIKELTTYISLIEIELAKLITKIGDLEDEISNELSDFSPELSEMNNISPDVLNHLKIIIDKLKVKLMSIGEIDPLVKEEFSEVSERFEFLSEQIADLNSAKDNLKKLTIELEKQIKEKFNGSFGIIADNFTKYFEILFSGGTAKIKLTADGNIDIYAKPPGKRIENINALSGGERTLTALSLLAAILDLNPSPFVVLDEVDASLDEVNTEKFLKIIKELSKKSQFIFITHNRGTMKVANLLYGVTMDENQTSSLLSIKLE